MDPLTLVGLGVQGATAIGRWMHDKWGRKTPKRPGFAASPLAQEWLRQSKEGIDVSGQLSHYSRGVMGQAHAADMATKGRMISQGMEGSIAGIKAQGEARRKAMGLIGAERSRLQDIDRQKREEAKMNYAKAMWQDQMAQYQEELARSERSHAATSGLIGTLGGLATQGIGAYAQSKAGPSFEDQLNMMKLQKGAMDIQYMQQQLESVGNEGLLSELKLALGTLDPTDYQGKQQIVAQFMSLPTMAHKRQFIRQLTGGR